MVDVRVAGTTETGWPEPGSAEELDRFAALQEKLEPLARTVISDPRAPQTVVVVPSLTLDAEELAKIPGVHHYEERMLCMLMLLRLPRTCPASTARRWNVPSPCGWASPSTATTRN